MYFLETDVLAKRNVIYGGGGVLSSDTSDVKVVECIAKLCMDVCWFLRGTLASKLACV